MGTKAILDDDGQLKIHARVVILMDNGRRLTGTRTGVTYFTRFSRNVDNAFHNALLDVVYQVLYDNGYSINGSDGKPLGSGDLLDKYSLDSYKILDYEINYLSDINKRGRIKYVTKNYRHHRYVYKYRDGKFESRSRYVYLSKKELNSRDLVEDYEFKNPTSVKPYTGRSNKNRNVRMEMSEKDYNSMFK